MKYAVYAPNVGPFGDIRFLSQMAREAEESGWDGFFIWDHMFWTDPVNFPTVDPWVALGAIAAVTNSIKIGTVVTPIPRRHPWKLAREVTSVDHLSNGRVILGVGIGHDAFHEYSAFGSFPNKVLRGEMLDEGLEILAGLWSGESFSYEGKHYQVNDAQFLPTPIQKHIPIWVAGMWPYKRPFRRAARYDGIVPIGTTAILEPEDMLTIKELVQANRSTDEPFDIVAGPTQLIGKPDAAEIAQRYADAGVTWWLEFFNHDGTMSIDRIKEGIRNGPPVK